MVEWEWGYTHLESSIVCYRLCKGDGALGGKAIVIDTNLEQGANGLLDEQ